MFPNKIPETDKELIEHLKWIERGNWDAQTHYQTLQAAILRLVQLTQPRPMETAPKDGTTILVLVKDWEGSSYSEVAWRDSKRGGWETPRGRLLCEGRTDALLGWLPMPEPPEGYALMEQKGLEND